MVARMKKVRGILLHRQHPRPLRKNPWVEPSGARSGDVNVPRKGNIKLSTYITQVITLKYHNLVIA